MPLAKRRLTRDGAGPSQPALPAAVDRFQLHAGEAYRIAYSIGASAQRRVSRSIAVFTGESERRRWGGDSIACLDFALPQGRQLSLLSDQLVDVRAATRNEQGQWVLLAEERSHRRPRATRRLAPRPT